MKTISKKYFWMMFGLLSLTVQTIQAAPIQIQHWQTKRGMHVYFVPENNLPILDVQLAFAAGSAHDGRQFGIANLTNALLFSGTNQYSAQQIAEQFENVGSLFEVVTNRDDAKISLRTLTKEPALRLSLSLLQKILKQPVFRPIDVERLKKQQIASIRLQQQSSSQLANHTLFEILYPHHPYGHDPLGTIETIQVLTQQDLKKFYKQYYVNKNAFLVLVGDLHKTQAEKIAQQLSQALPPGEAALPIPTVPRLTKISTNSQKWLTYDGQQTQIRLATLGIARNNKNYFPLMVGNFIFGGNITLSRLTENVREQHGLSYAVYSAFLPMEQAGPFVISLQTANQQTQQAFTITKDTLDNFIEKGPTSEELVSAKKNIIGSFARRLNSNNAIASTVLNIAFYHLPLDYIDTYQRHIQQVTAAQIKEAIQETLAPDGFYTVIVGKKSLHKTKIKNF